MWPPFHFRKRLLIHLFASALAGLGGISTAAAPSANFLRFPPTAGANPHYVTNRAPLQPAPLLKLPIGSITPQGWVRKQLEMEAGGMIGHLEDISKWCNFTNSAWATESGKGPNGWEELPYWLKGYGDLGYVLGNQQIIRNARKWIDATLASQEADGFFGPRENKTSLGGHPDLWPHMVMLNVLQSHYEFTRDDRVLPFMTKYLKWLNGQPAETFGRGYWPKLRFGDTIESAHWLYNRTGEPFLLELGRKIHDNMARWDRGIIDWHNVNIAQGFREPGVFFVQARDPNLLRQAERNYQEVMGTYGQFPGGGFAGDENCRKGYYDPRQGFETCGIVEFMHSFEMLTKISGDPVWAERCEELAFNSLPAALTPDLKALHYLTSANQVQLDEKNKAPGIQNSGNMFAYSPYEVFRCCQHNVSHAWPYYAEELWHATADRGLCASLYAACEVRATVASGQTVTIVEETDYPFDSTIRLAIDTTEPTNFPLYLRIPSWCAEPVIAVNGKRLHFDSGGRGYARIHREWKKGDVVTLKLPMTVSVRRWEKNQSAASVDYGPLTFSLKVTEEWKRSGGTEAWPEFEVFPGTPWNYALVLDEKNPSRGMKVKTKQGPLPDQPFTPENIPLTIEARARRVPEWQLDSRGLVGKLQPSPVRTAEPIQRVTLIPMGAARLRVTAFPVAGKGPDAQRWQTPADSGFTASHCFEGDSLESLTDEFEPAASDDTSIPRFTWWDHRGTTEWVQCDFPSAKRISSVSLFWFDDKTKGGQCRVPESWAVQYRNNGQWLPLQITGAPGTEMNTWNQVRFEPVQAQAIRVSTKLQKQYSAGILGLRIQ